MEFTTYVSIPNEIETSYFSVKKSLDYRHLHYHDCHEIYFLITGQRKYVINKNIIDVNKYDCVLIKEGILHRTFDGDGFERFLINFSESFLEKYATKEFCNYLMQVFSVEKISISKESFLKLKPIFKRMNEEKDEQLYISLVNVFSILLDNMRNDISHTESNDMISDILSYIEKNYKEINGLSVIAKEFYISKEHLCRLFKRQLGISVITYLNTIKIKHACELLNSTDKSITDIAFKCGFNSSMYFCKTFKDIIGISPGMYRNSIK